MRVVGVFSDCSEDGGIGRFGRAVSAAMCELSQRRQVDFTALALNDPPGTTELLVGDTLIPIRGFGRDKRRLAWELLRASRSADVVYFGHVNLAPLGLALRLRRPSIRYLVAAHGIEVWSPLPLYRRIALRAATGVTAVSAHTAKMVTSMQGVNPRRIRIVPNCLPPGFPLTPVTDAPSNMLMILSVSRLRGDEPGKGIDRVIRALPAVAREVPGVKYVVVGDGDLRRSLQQLADSLGVGNRVHFTGSVSDPALMGWYRDTTVFVLPSRQEGFGIVFLEAMAYGKPVVGGRAGGATDVIEDGVSGFLVAYDDLDALTDRLIQLLTSSELRQMMGRAGYERVLRHFSFDRFVDDLEAALLPDATKQVSAGLPTA